MTEEVREKLLQVYREALGPIADVFDIFVDYYGESMVDINCKSFNEFLEWLSGRTLGNLGITQYHTDYYNIDRDDYEANGRGKKFLDYIPDLGIIEYCKSAMIKYIRDSFSRYDQVLGVAIYVRWPKVRITNEYDKFVDITELYAEVRVDTLGRIIRRFNLTRTEYNLMQWVGGYTHSHVPSFSPAAGPPTFRRPCTGSGPINNTISTLQVGFDSEIWGLFVYELDKYVRVESIAGVPYYRLENIGRGAIFNIGDLGVPYEGIPSYRRGYQVVFGPTTLKEFIKYFLSKKCMKFNFRNGSYGLGESFIEFWLKVSNCFIEWYNLKYADNTFTLGLDQLVSTRVIGKYIVAGNGVYNSDRTDRIATADQFEGFDMFKFKGTMLKLHITDRLEFNNVSFLVDVAICGVILTKVLKLVNALYGREQTTGEAQGGETSPSEELCVL